MDDEDAVLAQFAPAMQLVLIDFFVFWIVQRVAPGAARVVTSEVAKTRATP